MVLLETRSPETRARVTGRECTSPSACRSVAVGPPTCLTWLHKLHQADQRGRATTPDNDGARPIYHHKRESIEAHLTIVFAALAVTRFVENATGWSIKRFMRTARRYRTVQIRAGAPTLTAEDPPPPDLRDALAQIN